MARCQQCFYRFLGRPVADRSDGTSTVSLQRISDSSRSFAGQLVAPEAQSGTLGTRNATSANRDSDPSDQGAGCDDPSTLAPEEYEIPYHVRVDGFERARVRRGVRGWTVYTLTVSHGNAHWPIRRRYRQIALLHQRLSQALGTHDRAGLPQPPRKFTLRSMLMGNFDQGFLQSRCQELQVYLDSLLAYIPYVDQCECLREFLCAVDQRFLDDYERLLDLQEAVGSERRVQLLPKAAVAALPRSKGRCSKSVSGSPVFEYDTCAICQDTLDPNDDEHDVRVLSCGHEYHFKCIARWLEQSNSCCICQSVVEPPSTWMEEEA